MNWLLLSHAAALLLGLSAGCVLFRPRGKLLQILVTSHRLEHENNILRVRCRRDQVEISNLLAIISRRRHVPSSRPPQMEVASANQA